MSYELKQIRLDKLNIPTETLRKSSFPANDIKLKTSIEAYGVIVPLIVTELGKGEYSVSHFVYRWMVQEEQRF